MGGVGGTTTENILAECDLLEAGNFTLVTDKSGIKVFSPSQVRLRGKPIAVGNRAGDKCTYFDLQIHSLDKEVMDGSVRYAQDSQLNVPAKDASPTTIRLYEIWKRLHCSQNHMKKDK